jgi:hypothetical protein
MKKSNDNNMIKSLKIVLLTGIILSLSSCEKAIDYYLGVPMQPNFFEDSNWQKVMNLFGVIRPDSGTVPMSFVFIQQTFPTKGASDKEDYIIKNAEVYLYVTKNSGLQDTIKLDFYESQDTTTWKFPRYKADSLKPQAGDHYKLHCIAPELPDVTGETTVPAIPKIVDGSMNLSSQKMVLELFPDTVVYLYDIYLFSENDMTTKRFFHSSSYGLKVEWTFGKQAQWKYLAIYAYDRNLAKYMTTATNSLYSFNVYRPPITSVEGGFGVFGAMNCLFVNLPAK